MVAFIGNTLRGKVSGENFDESIASCQKICHFSPINVLRYMVHNNTQLQLVISRLTVVSREAKEEVPCDGLSTNAREYFTRTNLVKIKNAITDER